MKLINFKLIEKGAALASFDVEFKPLIVRGMMLFRNGDAGTFINEPAEAYQDGRTGERRYSKHVVIKDEQLRAQIQQQAKEMYAAKVAEDGRQQGQEQQWAPGEEPF
ncbi:MAG: hypothetical protein ACYC9I_11515 [Desulfuromonadales bacterium]